MFCYGKSAIIDVAGLVFIQLYFQVCRTGVQNNSGDERQIQGDAKPHAGPRQPAAGFFIKPLFGYEEFPESDEGRLY